jgi:hypothetical protein
METCRACGADLRPGLAWCPRCLTPREEPAPVYGQTTLIQPEPPKLDRFELSERGFGPGMRWILTGVVLFFLYAMLFWNFLYALGVALAMIPVLWDVWTRHRAR